MKINKIMEIEACCKYLQKNNVMLQKKTESMLRWTNSKSELEGAATKKISNMLEQCLIQLGLKRDHVYSCLKTIYVGNLRDFSADSHFMKLEKIFKAKYPGKIFVLDLFHKEYYHQALETCLDYVNSLSNINISSFTIQEKMALIVFLQIVFSGARSGYNDLGFGFAEDFVANGKKRIGAIKIKENQRKQKEYNDAMLKARIARMNGEESEEENDEFEPKMKETDESLTRLSPRVVDSWEDL